MLNSWIFKEANRQVEEISSKLSLFTHWVEALGVLNALNALDMLKFVKWTMGNWLIEKFIQLWCLSLCDS